MNRFFITAFVLILCGTLYAQPSTITYQGVLTDDSGNLITGSENIRFDIFNVETGGSSLWNETHSSVSVSNGLFNVELGSVSSFGTLDFSQALWLEITVGSTTLTPRIAFNASGYAKYGEISTHIAGGDEGSIPYQTGDGITAMLSAGTAGQVLMMNGSGTAPTWSDALSTTLTSSYLFVGNSSNEATAREMTGDVTISNTGVTAIGESKVTNAMLTGSIADSKLSTISTSGKVSNSATTATSSNTANTIVARDTSGNFTAGTVTADLTGDVTGDLTGTADLADDLTGGAEGSIPYQTASDATSMLAKGSAGQVLTMNAGATAPEWATPSSDLNYWNESTSGDGTVSYTSTFTPNSAETHVDAAISPKGTGALVANASASGSIDNRGNYAVDLQMARSVNTQVAGGNYAVIMGGGYNTASGLSATIAGGGLNTASGDNSTVVGGGRNTASGNYSVASGYWNTAQSYGETVMGIYATVGSGTQGSRVDGDRLFVIGNGTSPDVSDRSNAITILKNANTTIGGSLTLNGNGTDADYTFPTGRGTNGQVLTTNGSGGTSWITPYSGLSHFSESRNATSPNDTKPAHMLEATGSGDNLDLVIMPKGSGALLAQLPDGTSSGGNKRGNYAVDLQMSRNGNTEVASGDNSVIAGGFINTASGDYSTVVGGGRNTASGNYSYASGRNNTAPSYCETVIGYFATTYTPVENGATLPNSTDRLFVVGNGTYSNRSNAFTILKNATTIIGDNGYDGILKLYSEQGLTDYSVQFQPHSAMTEAVTYTLPADNGDADQVLTTDGSGNLSWEVAGGGLTNFTESNFTYDSKYGVKLLATYSGQTNADFVIQPKGSGALLAQQPDGTSAGGNKRGESAVDLQMVRYDASNVAIGDFSTISGGIGNTASWQTDGRSTVGGGERNNASGDYSTISGGYDNVANGKNSTISGGELHIASGFASSIIGGTSNTASGEYSVSGGLSNTAQSYGETVYGINATVGSGTQDSRVDGDRLFVIGNGVDSDNRSNALVILKNGNTTINGGVQVGFTTYNTDGDMSGLTTYSMIKYTYSGAVTGIPTASGYSGKILYIINASGDTRTINGNGVADGSVIQLISDGSSWYTVSVTP
jgi:hypothetical protein